MSWYYYNQSGEKIGPKTADEIIQLARQGMIERETRLVDPKGRTGLAKQLPGKDGRGLPFPEEIPVDWSGDVVSYELKGHTDGVGAVAFSPDGKWITTTGRWDKTARIWDVVTGKEVQKLIGHTQKVCWVAFSPNGKRIATRSDDDFVRILDCATGEVIHKLEGNSVVFSPDGKRIATVSDKTARIWDVASGKELHKLAGHVFSVVFSPDGKQIATKSDDSTSRIWEVATGKERHKLEGHTDNIESVTFSPDGKRIATASFDKTARIWDVASGKELHKLAGHAECVFSVVFSPNGKRVVTTSLDNTARIWDIAIGKEIYILKGFIIDADSAAFSLDGKWIVIANDDNTTSIWDVTTGKGVRKLVGHTEHVWNVAFSPDGKQIVTASKDNTARVWVPVDVAFSPVKKENTITAYETYITKYSEAPNRKEALADMYELVKQENSVACYTWFLVNFTEASQAADALKRMYAEAFKAARQVNTIEALNDFIIAYPLAKEVNEAQAIAYQLEKERYSPADSGEREDKARMLLNKSRRIWLDGEDVQQPAWQLGYALVVQRMTNLLETEFPAQKATSEILDSEEARKFRRELKQSLGNIQESLNRIEDAIHHNTQQTAALIRQQTDVMSHHFGIMTSALQGISFNTQVTARQMPRLVDAANRQAQSQEYLNWQIGQFTDWFQRKCNENEQRRIGSM